jgi:hypothetical protein
MNDDHPTHDESQDGKKRHRHDADRSAWAPTRAKNSPRPAWKGKTMHHPAFRIGEIKHGR